MTDLKDTPFPEILKTVATRLAVPAKWGSAPFTEARFKLPRADFYVKFEPLVFTVHLGESGAYNELIVPGMGLRRKQSGEYVRFALMEGKIALLFHSEGADFYDDLPKRDAYMAYDAFVAGWSTYSYRLWERNTLSQALGLKIPAEEVA